uniref:Putative conserved protein with signal anchor n=1 Tax=Nyssomyia neivai TaxID=330878 RepID=A0A1L8DUZ8_9DIPT
MEAISGIWKFINYWWFRWTLVTEMYMVEKWERITINCLFVVLFLAFWYFNYKVILAFTTHLTSALFWGDQPTSRESLKTPSL